LIFHVHLSVWSNGIWSSDESLVFGAIVDQRTFASDDSPESFNRPKIRPAENRPYRLGRGLKWSAALRTFCVPSAHRVIELGQQAPPGGKQVVLSKRLLRLFLRLVVRIAMRLRIPA